MSAAPTIHANCVVLGEAGVLIRGPSGSGKSALSAALVERAEAAGLFARLVADDRVRLTLANGRLIASAAEAIAGLMERRGLGVARVKSLEAAVLRLVVDIAEKPERMPEADDLSCEIDGVRLPCMAVAAGDPEAAGLILFRVRRLGAARGCDPMGLAFAPQHGKISGMALDAPDVRTDRVEMARGGLSPERNEFCAETA